LANISILNFLGGIIMKKRIFAILILLSVFLLTGTAFSVETKPDELSAKTEAISVIQNLADGKYKAVYMLFDDSIKDKVSESVLKTSWEQMVSQLGSFREIKGVANDGNDNYKIRCAFEKGEIIAALSFNKKGKLAYLLFKPIDDTTPWKPPVYVNTDKFSESDIKFGSEEWELPGTLSIPKGEGKFPVLVLVHGSGPNDRDETIGPNKIFKDIAWGLASNGVAVLRYEKRTRYYPLKVSQQMDKLTLDSETVDDAVEAVKYLKKVPEINPERIFVLGHSLGGTAIPRIAAKDGNQPAGFIVMAGASRPLEDVVAEQFEYIFGLDGKLTDEEKAELEKIKKQAAKVKDPNLSPSDSPKELPLGIPAAYWLDLRNYKPAEEAAKITRPILLLQGSRDYQVTLDNWEIWKKALAGKNNAKFCLFPGLNHLFIKGEGKSVPSEYMKPDHVDEAVINEISGWILNRKNQGNLP
jgi:dienelactone hydrolase